MNENRQAQKRQKESESASQGMDAMLDALKELSKEGASYPPQQSEEDSDVAPMSAIVDTPSKEDLIKKEQKRAERSLKLASASSASEDESATERKRKYLAAS